jgi:hypothetical protein
LRQRKAVEKEVHRYCYGKRQQIAPMATRAMEKVCCKLRGLEQNQSQPNWTCGRGDTVSRVFHIVKRLHFFSFCEEGSLTKSMIPSTQNAIKDTLHRSRGSEHNQFEPK